MKSYKEKIEILYNKMRFSPLIEDSLVVKRLEEIFPELKSEDERIRGEIIGIIRNAYWTSNRDRFNKLVAWLENQKSEPNWYHHKVDLSNCSEEYRKAYYDGWNNCNMQHSQCKSDGNGVVKCLINGMKCYYEDNEEATWGTEKFNMKVKDILNWLEKQGEQKVEPHIISTQEYMCENDYWDPAVRNGGKQVLFKGTKYMGSDIIRIISKWKIDFLNEEIYFKLYFKPIEASVKFKVGDWIVFNGLTLYIKEVVKGYYRTISKGGIVNSYDWDIDNVARLWTIQDAKDGDVLQLGEVTAIFKKYIHNEDCTCYCSFSKDGGFEIPIENGDDNVYGCYNSTLATKEQRNLLFQKMKEAGYEWLEETKELKKVGQKLAELAKGEDYGIDGLYAAVDILQKTLGKVDGYQTDDGILEHECAISAVKELISAAKKLYEQKHALSEEDEIALDDALWCCKQAASIAKDENDMGNIWYAENWLKSLKERLRG